MLGFDCEHAASFAELGRDSWACRLVGRSLPHVGNKVLRDDFVNREAYHRTERQVLTRTAIAPSLRDLASIAALARRIAEFRPDESPATFDRAVFPGVPLVSRFRGRRGLPVKWWPHASAARFAMERAMDGTSFEIPLFLFDLCRRTSLPPRTALVALLDLAAKEIKRRKRRLSPLF